MSYVDGYVLPVVEARLGEYRTIATRAGEVWMKHGAVAYKECVIDDDRIAEMASFTDISGAKPGEKVVFAFVVFHSREHRDEVNAKVMKELCEQEYPTDMPFDMKRMAYGGFRALVDF